MEEGCARDGARREARAEAMAAEVVVCHVGGEGELRCSRAGKTWGDAREREAEPRSAGRRTGEADAR